MKTLLLLFLFSTPVFADLYQKFETDSSIVEIRDNTNFGLNSIEEYNRLKDSNKTYYKKIFSDTKNLRTEGIIIGDYYVGVWNFYSNEGILEEVLDYDKGIWTVYDKHLFPYYDLKQRMKSKGDSLIINIYGKLFFDTHILLNIYGSSLREFNDWNKSESNPPDSYLLRYDIKMLDGTFEREMIQLELDSLGGYIPCPYEEINGFERLESNEQNTLRITFKEALEKAKKLGLKETDSIKAYGSLHWDSFEKPELYNGKFKYYVTILKETIKSKVPENRTRIVHKFDVYVFNPWTGDFIEKKKMISRTEWGKNSGHSTGLMPDE